jgi:hypothetical protein
MLSKVRATVRQALIKRLNAFGMPMALKRLVFCREQMSPKLART